MKNLYLALQLVSGLLIAVCAGMELVSEDKNEVFKHLN